jgi:aspartyl protease family protein
MSEHNPHRRHGVLMLGAAWLIVLGGGWWFFHGWLERQHNPNQVVQTTASGDVVLERNRSGHYVASGAINDVSVTFLVDTGATDVALSSALARRLGLERGPQVTLMTANGRTTGYRTRLGSVRIGSIVLPDVAASFSDGIDDDTVLLGMSFLKRLEFSQRDGRLVLHAARNG